MAQRKSGFERHEADFFPSPKWVTEALGEVVEFRGLRVWEPATGSGTMAEALTDLGAVVWESDLRGSALRSGVRAVDFLCARFPPEVDAVVTNPPFGLGGRTAVRFIERGLDLLRDGSPVRLLALLLAVDFDSASGRRALFSSCVEFSVKIVLLRRIKWFDGPSSPSTNHAWFIWQRRETKAPQFGPQLLYAPQETLELGVEEF